MSFEPIKFLETSAPDLVDSDFTEGLSVSLLLDDIEETATLRTTNLTGNRITYGLSIISATGTPYTIETCPLDDGDTATLAMEGQIFSAIISEIRAVNGDASCRNYSLNDYPLLSTHQQQ